MLQAVPYPDSA